MDTNSGGYILQNAEDWSAFLGSMQGAIFVARATSDTNGQPKEFPCIVKGSANVVLDEDGAEMPAVFIIFFYKEDALALLGMERAPIEGYTYAEAI